MNLKNIQQEIDFLTMSLNSLENDAEDVKDLNVETVYVQGFTGIADSAQELYDQETADSRASEEQYAQDAAAEVISNSTQVINSYTQTLIDEIDRVSNDYIQSIDNLEDGIMDSLNDISNDINQMNTNDADDSDNTENF